MAEGQLTTVEVQRYGHNPDGTPADLAQVERVPLAAGSSEEVEFKLSTGDYDGVLVEITADGEKRKYLIAYTELVNAGLRVWNRDLRVQAGEEEA